MYVVYVPPYWGFSAVGFAAGCCGFSAVGVAAAGVDGAAEGAGFWVGEVFGAEVAGGEVVWGAAGPQADMARENTIIAPTNNQRTLLIFLPLPSKIEFLCDVLIRRKCKPSKYGKQSGDC